MACKDVLPPGYKRCKYLESNKKQYINTGIIQSSTRTWDVHIQQIGTSGNGWVGSGVDFGAAAAVNLLGYGKISCGISVNGKWKSPIRSPVSTDFEKHSITLKSGLFIVDGFEITTPEWTNYSNSNVAITLFGFATQWNSSAVGLLTGKQKIYYHRVIDSDVTIQEFIPALDESGVPCMYDIITATPFYNNGSGTFGYELMDGTYIAPQ